MNSFKKMTIHSKLLKASALAHKAGMLVTTIRFYTKIGLLEAAAFSPGGYNLYNEDDSLLRLKKIKFLKQKRRTLDEIKRTFAVEGKRKRT